MRSFRSSLVLVALSVAACSGGGTTVIPPPPPPEATVDHVVIDNGDFTINVDETRQLQVRALTATGSLVTDAVVAYTSSAPAAATVSASGLVTSLAPGSTTITATSAGKSASITVTVQLVPIATFSLEIPRQVIKTNDTTQIVTTLRDANNNILQDRMITWESSDSTIVLVGPTGIVFGLSPGGPVTITGRVEGKTASVTILVTPALVGSVRIIPDTALVPPDSSQQFRVEVLDEFGGPVENPLVIWASAAAQIAAVSPTGLVTGVQLGETRVFATVGGVTGESLVRVSLPEVERFTISVDNHLRSPLSITENGVVVGVANASSISTIQRPLTEHAVLGWILIRPGGLGEPMSGSLPDIVNPTGTISMDVTNVLADGRVYFTPVIRSFNGQKNPINFPVVELAALCHCAVSSAETVSRNYGYWRLFPNSVLEVFGQFDAAMAGPKIVVPILMADVEPTTGIWRYNLLLIP